VYNDPFHLVPLKWRCRAFYCNTDPGRQTSVFNFFQERDHYWTLALLTTSTSGVLMQ